MRYVASTLAGLLFLCAGTFAPGGAAIAACGDGVVQGGEECDPGGALHRFGNPSLSSCDGGGGDGVPGSECFFQFTCCKFNCQFANPGPCFDGNECTTNDQCNNVGQCILGTGVAAGTACGDPAGTDCNLPDTCNGAGTCSPNLVPQGGLCGSPPSAECDAADRCNGAGACVPQATPAGTPAPTQCNDGNACTADQCNGAGGCQQPNLPGGTPCGNPSSGQCDLPDSCNGAGACAANHKPDGTGCSDGLFCTTTDVCGGGVCAGSGNPCAGNPPCQDFCNEATQGCLAPAGTSCDDDGDACNGGATCNAGGACLPGTPLPDGAACDDGNPCTVLDTCAGQDCQGGPTFVAERKVKVNNAATIGDDVAAWDVAGSVKIGKNGFMPDGTSVTGHKVKLGGATSVFDVRANLVTSKGATIRGATVTPLTLPLTGSFCTTPPLACGGPDVLVPPLGSATIMPGSYGNILLGEAATLDLLPGTYELCQLKAGRTTRITFLPGGQSVFKVEGNLRVLNESFFGPATGAPWPIVYVGGSQARFGHYSESITHVVAPGAKIGVGLDGLYDGTMCGRDLKSAWRVTWRCTDPGLP